MKLEDALKQKLFRPVEVKTNGFPEPYKDKPFLDYRKFLEKEVVIVNVESKFLFLKDKDLANVTLTALNKHSIVYIDKPELLENSNFKKPNSSGFVKVRLNKSTLQANIVKLSDVYSDILVANFSELVMKVLNDEPLNESQIISLFCDKRTSDILEIDQLLKLTKDVELIEIVQKATPRARLLLQEVFDGNPKPLSARLFENKKLKDIKRLA